jgi:hypothetical protein
MLSSLTLISVSVMPSPSTSVALIVKCAVPMKLSKARPSCSWPR